MALSDNEKREIEADALVDSQDDTEREYKGDALVDFVFAPVDWLAGTQSTGDHAREQQEYYDSIQSARERR